MRTALRAAVLVASVLASPAGAAPQDETIDIDETCLAPVGPDAPFETEPRLVLAQIDEVDGESEIESVLFRLENRAKDAIYVDAANDSRPAVSVRREYDTRDSFHSRAFALALLPGRTAWTFRLRGKTLGREFGVTFSWSGLRDARRASVESKFVLLYRRDLEPAAPGDSVSLETIGWEKPRTADDRIEFLLSNSLDRDVRIRSSWIGKPAGRVVTSIQEQEVVSGHVAQDDGEALLPAHTAIRFGVQMAGQVDPFRVEIDVEDVTLTTDWVDPLPFARLLADDTGSNGPVAVVIHENEWIRVLNRTRTRWRIENRTNATVFAKAISLHPSRVAVRADGAELLDVKPTLGGWIEIPPGTFVIANAMLSRSERFRVGIDVSDDPDEDPHEVWSEFVAPAARVDWDKDGH